jgi:hypothetical protein
MIVDSQRVIKLPDAKVQNFLVRRLKSNRKSIKRLIFINKRREIIDIDGLI